MKENTSKIFYYHGVYLTSQLPIDVNFQNFSLKKIIIIIIIIMRFVYTYSCHWPTFGYPHLMIVLHPKDKKLP